VLAELRVRQLGVIADLDLVLGPGLTVITGETGAGKTLVVEALALLLGGRVDAAMLRSGCEEALVEGRFLGHDGGEVVLARALARQGRARAYLDGRMVPTAVVAELGASLVELYGQHLHQALLRPAAQRAALDRFAAVDLGPVRRLREEARANAALLAALGGDGASRERELDLLRFELAEIEQAAIASEAEDDHLALEEEALASAAALREAATAAMACLADDARANARDLLAASVSLVEGHAPLEAHAARLAALLAELEDAARDLRRAAEALEEDPVRLGEVRARRQLLARLARKHGGTLAGVLAAAAAHRERLGELAASEARRAALEARAAELAEALANAERAVGDQRRRAAAPLASQVQSRLHALGLAEARFAVEVGEGIGDAVEFLLGANPGEPLQPLARVASGGELARAMLALRLVLSEGPETLVFDEVDAGIGGAAALALGGALAELAASHQVLLVTHLAQVAARADVHLVVEKVEEAGRTTASVRQVEGEDRVRELSRMLSGHPGSRAAREHASELLASLRRER